MAQAFKDVLKSSKGESLSCERSIRVSLANRDVYCADPKMQRWCQSMIQKHGIVALFDSGCKLRDLAEAIGKPNILDFVFDVLAGIDWIIANGKFLLQTDKLLLVWKGSSPQ